MENDEMKTLLQSIEALSNLSPALLERIVELTEWRVFSKGAPIYLEGAPAEHVMAIISGRVHVYHSSSDGAELLVDEYAAPALFGEADAFTGGSRRENASACSKATVGFIPVALVLELVREEPQVAISLLVAGARRVTRASSKQKAMAFDPIPKRAAQFLLEVAQRNNPSTERNPVVAITQDLIATAVGATRRSIASAMSEWQSKGFLVRMAKGYEIADLAAFERLAA